MPTAPSHSSVSTHNSPNCSMTIGGLTTLLGKHPTNFKPIFLSNTAVVINALDFMGHVHEGISSTYGDENLVIHLKLKHVLSVFNECGIVPYFVFAGGKENRGHQLNSKFLKTLNALRNAERPPDSVPTFQHTELAVGAKATTVESLRKLHAQFTFVPHSSLRCTASLAIRLNCPLIASSSDYFALVSAAELCDATDAQSFRFVPLRYLSFQPISQQSCMLPAHEFLPLNSELASVNPKHRPLLALLLGTDSMPRSRLPPEVQAAWKSNESSHPKERRFSVLVHWLSQHRSNIEAPIDQVIDAYPEAHRPSFIHQLTDCLANYIYHPLVDSKGLSKQLQIPNLSPSESTDDLTAALELTSFDDTQCSQAQFVQEDIFKLLRGSRDDRAYLSDFTVGWPDRLVNAYRCGKVLSSFMRALYSSGFSMTSKANDLSADVCLPLRVMHYRIMLGLERQLGGCIKLIGLSPHATEYFIRDGRAIACMIPISPIVINMAREQTDRVLGTLFSVTLPTAPTQPGWMLGLAAVLSYCRSNVPESFGLVPFEQCSVALALIGCAVVAADEPDSVDDSLSQHFTGVADGIASQHEKVDCKTETHAELFGVVQRVYYAFNSLVNLLESILPHTHESQLFHFLPAWNIFPSGRLVHWLAVDLDSKPPATRQRAMSMCWLPRLCQTKPDVSAAKVRCLVSSFETILQTISSLPMPKLSVKYDLREIPVHGLSSNNVSHSSPKSEAQVDENKLYNSPSGRGTPTQRGTPFIKPRLSYNSHGSVASLPQNFDSKSRSGVHSPLENGDSGFTAQNRRGSLPFRGRASRRRPPSQYADRLRLRLEENVQS